MLGGWDHHLLGSEERAREQLELAPDVLHLLGDGEYGRTVRSAIGRLDTEL